MKNTHFCIIVYLQHIAREDENVLANLKQYNLESHYIDVVVGDSSLPLWKPGLKLDAIITDRKIH